MVLSWRQEPHHHNSSLHTQHNTICSNGAMWRLSTCINKLVLLLGAAFYNHGTLAHAATAACRIHLMQLWSGVPGGGRLTRFMRTSLHPCTAPPSAHRTSIRCARTPHAHTARRDATQRCKGLNSRQAWHFTTMQHSGSCCSASVQNPPPDNGSNLFVCLCEFCSFRFCSNLTARGVWEAREEHREKGTRMCSVLTDGTGS
jgi:hypothetical protein